MMYTKYLQASICFVLFVFVNSKICCAYEHDRYQTNPVDIRRNFEAFVVSFDSPDDDDGDGQADIRRIPEWVSYQVNRYPGSCIPTSDRPQWFTDTELTALGVAPGNESYSYPKSWRDDHPDWYVRGHLCMKFIADRIGSEAAFNTFTLLNSVPQRVRFNNGIWEDLEQLTSAWAQRYGQIWVITGPIFHDRRVSHWIGEAGELPVAAPDALFKIVVKQSIGTKAPDVLAFIYPQTSSDYDHKPYPHEKFLVSVDEIERLTRLDFLTLLPDDLEDMIESRKSDNLWSVESSNFIKGCPKK